MRWQRLAMMAFACTAFLLAATPCSADPPVSFVDYGKGTVTYAVFLPPPPAIPVTSYQEYSLESLANVDQFPLAPGATAVGHHTLTFVGIPGVWGTHGPISNGLVIYTTADGATLTGTFSGSFVRIPDPTTDLTDPSQGFVVLTEDVKFGHGTGRLHGVTGTAQIVILAIGKSDPRFTYTMVGTLRNTERP